MAKIVAIIIAMIGLVIGVNMLEPINTARLAITTASFSAAVTALSGLLPLLFVVIIMMFAVKAID